jgi:hypothetical protein
MKLFSMADEPVTTYICAAFDHAGSIFYVAKPKVIFYNDDKLFNNTAAWLKRNKQRKRNNETLYPSQRGFLQRICNRTTQPEFSVKDTSMIEYRLHFETNERAPIELFEQRASATFPCFTLQETIGYWQGTMSPAYIFSVISAENIGPDVKSLALFIKDLYAQDAVFYTETRIFGELI